MRASKSWRRRRLASNVLFLLASARGNPEFFSFIFEWQAIKSSRKETMLTSAASSAGRFLSFLLLFFSFFSTSAWASASAQVRPRLPLRPLLPQLRLFGGLLRGLLVFLLAHRIYKERVLA